MVWVHRIISKDTENKLGVCSNCGPVEIGQKKNSWICMPGKRENVQRAAQKRRYGIVIDNRPTECEVCRSDRKICYDHNHGTGEFRGWLCSGCNLALGNVGDNPDTLRRLAEYLERNK